jgi:hypothetical protein
MAVVMSCGAALVSAAHAGEPLSPSAYALMTAPLAAPGDPISDLLAKPESDAAGVGWRSAEVPFAPKSALRISVGDPLAYSGAPSGGGPLQPPGSAATQAYELSVVHDWPGAVSFNTDRFGLNLSPHAGVGVTSYGGGLAEAGATLQLSERVAKGLGKLGVRDGAAFGDQGRWYLFAAASGRAVGLNMLRGDAGWTRAGFTTDPTSTLVGDAQVGVGWRKGALQTSVGFVHREMKGMHTLYGQDVPSGDSLVAFSISVKPRK